MIYKIDNKFYRIHQLLFIIPRTMCIANRGVYVAQWLMPFTSNNKPLMCIRTSTPIWSVKVSRHLSMTRVCLVGGKNCLPFAGAWFPHPGFWWCPCCSSLWLTVLCFLFCLSSFCVLYAEHCQFLWIVYSWFLLRVSLKFISMVSSFYSFLGFLPKLSVEFLR